MKSLQERLIFLTSNFEIPGCVEGRKSLYSSEKLFSLIENFKILQTKLDESRLQFVRKTITVDPLLHIVEELKESAFDIGTFTMMSYPELYKQIEKSLTGFVFTCFNILKETQNQISLFS